MISVIIPTHNREKTIIRAVNSVLIQTYRDLELIVVDDCSTDNSIELLKGITDKRLKIIKLEKNSGACVARNIGIENAKGEYIAFQDSDDEWLNNKLEIQFNKLINENYDMIFCAINRINGKDTTKIPENGYIVPNNNDEFTKMLLKENVISTQTILAKKEVFLENKFDKDFPRFQDWDLVVRISKKYKIGYCDEPFVNLFIQNDSISKNPGKGIVALELMYEKNKEMIESDLEIRLSFLRKKCFLCYFDNQYCIKDIKEYLKYKKDKKLLMILIFNYLHCIRIINFLKKMIKKIKQGD